MVHVRLPLGGPAPVPVVPLVSPQDGISRAKRLRRPCAANRSEHRVLHLTDNQLRSVPAEIGQLASLRELYLYGNQLTSVPVEIGQLTSLKKLTIS